MFETRFAAEWVSAVKHLFIKLVQFATLMFAFAVAHADTVRLTIYDDGLSCPAGCDAHVVFHKEMNGTEFAHLPSTTSSPFSKCVAGAVCRLCLESGGKQCLEAMYRGGGPTVMTFDLTPRFYQTACASTPAQPLLAAKCARLAKAAAKLEGRKNCISEPKSEGCKSLIDQAVAAKRADRVEYLQCNSIGEAAYNKTKAEAQQRSNRCAYERRGTGGPNSKGTTWKRLLPGACRDETFVGRDGHDCCSGLTAADGPLGLECAHFYPK